MIVIYIILFITSIFFYILYRGAFSFYLLGFLIILPIVLNILLSYCRKKVRVSFVNTNLMTCKNEKTPITIKVENNSSVPIPNCIITVIYSNRLFGKAEKLKVNTPVFPKNTQYLTLNMTSSHYGTIDLKITSVKLVDFLKFFKRKIPVSGISSETTVYIAPQFFQLSNDIADYSNLGLESESYSKIKSGDDPSEIFDIHEYHDGDKINRVHWKLTAKSDKTMVKDFSLPITNSIMIAMDLSMSSDADDEQMDLYDSMLETVSSLSMYLTENECPHKVIWYSKEKSDNEVSCISDIEDYREMINKLLFASPAEKRNLVLDILNAEQYDNVKVGHMIFCTAHYDDTVFNKLSSSESAVRYTVLSMCNDAKEVRSESENGGSTVISVPPNRIAESIDYLCL